MNAKQLGMLLILLMGIPTLTAQTLSNQVVKATQGYIEDFTQIPEDRLAVLDQVAYRAYLVYKRHKQLDVVLVDRNNGPKSQLAQVWLQTGFYYYRLMDLGAQSAGTNPMDGVPTELADLKNEGFKVKKARKDGSDAYAIDYGSGSWTLFSKSLPSISKKDSHCIIAMETAETLEGGDESIQLPFTASNNIALEMLYLVARLDHLING